MPSAYHGSAMTKICKMVAQRLNVDYQDIVGRSRSVRVSEARFMAMALIRGRLEVTLVSIGEYFDRDHSTASHAIEKFKALAAKNPALAQVYEELLTAGIPEREDLVKAGEVEGLNTDTMRNAVYQAQTNFRLAQANLEAAMDCLARAGVRL